MSDAIANALRIAAPQDPSGISRALIDALRQKAASGDPNAQAGMAQHDAAMTNPLWGSSTYLSQQPANNLGEALQKVPPEAMFLSNFLGPGPKRLPGSILESKRPGQYDARVGDRFAGTMSIADAGEKPFVSAIDIEPQFRRHGLAKAFYEQAEKDLGRPLVPSPLGLTDEAIAFWKARLGAMPQEQARSLIDEAMRIGRGYGIRDQHLNDRFAPLRSVLDPVNK